MKKENPVARGDLGSRKAVEAAIERSRDRGEAANWENPKPNDIPRWGSKVQDDEDRRA